MATRGRLLASLALAGALTRGAVASAGTATAGQIPGVETLTEAVDELLDTAGLDVAGLVEPVEEVVDLGTLVEPVIDGEVLGIVEDPGEAFPNTPWEGGE